MNDEERRQWVENNEELYTRWQRSGAGLYRWTREHREEIDEIIEIVMGRRLPATMPWSPHWGSQS